jgi:hypothetical protein
MKLYSCKVRLHGDVRDEVRKDNVTQAEITVLRRIHGEDAVLEIRTAGATDRNEAAERDRLNAAYGEGTVNKIFGMPVVRITDEVSISEEVEDVEELATKPVELPVVKKGRGRPPKFPLPEPTADAAPAESSIGTLTE